MPKDALSNIVPEADLHCHLLPDWDDGPRTLEESLRMAEQAAQSGLRRILVTPHVGRPLGARVEKSAREIPAAVADLESKIKAQGIDIDLVTGAELTLDLLDLPERLPDEPWLTIGGQGAYILLESIGGRWPDYAGQMLYEIGLRGVSTIIAHPERYVKVQRDPSSMHELVEQGALLQVTARSLLGHDDRVIKRCSLSLLESGLVALIASDAHAANSVLPRQVVEIVSSVVGSDEARRIFIENPRLVLQGEPVAAAQGPRATRREAGPSKSFISRLFKTRRSPYR